MPGGSNGRRKLDFPIFFSRWELDMSEQNNGKALDNIFQNGDPDGRERKRICDNYGDKLMAQIHKDLRRYPALQGKVSASDIFQSVIAGLRQAKNPQPVQSETAVLIDRVRRRIRHHNRKFSGPTRDHRREDRSDKAKEGLMETTPSPWSVVSQREQLALARELLESLSPKHRELLTLREVDRLTFPQIAERLRVSREEARALVGRAMKELMAKVKERGFQ
jgi:RNA polymerase sigma factor (sigma-70 family)